MHLLTAQNPASWLALTYPKVELASKPCTVSWLSHTAMEASFATGPRDSPGQRGDDEDLDRAWPAQRSMMDIRGVHNVDHFGKLLGLPSIP